MSSHSPHPPTHEHGLADGCDRCDEHAGMNGNDVPTWVSWRLIGHKAWTKAHWIRRPIGAFGTALLAACGRSAAAHAWAAWRSGSELEHCRCCKRPKKPQCAGSYQPPMLLLRGHTRDVGVHGSCPVCGRWYRLSRQGRISRHNAPKEAPS